MKAPLHVLVTGGAGFIGSELTAQLLQLGHHVTVIDNLVNGKQENLLGLPQNYLRLVIADIRNAVEIKQALQGVDVVFHLACLGVRHSIHSPVENHEVNATATLNLLETARKAGVGRFVYISTSEVYGTARTVPMTEDHPVWPQTVYGASKLAGECYARAFHETYAYPTVVIRPFNAFGPRCHHEGDCGEVIPRFMLRSMAGLPMVIFGDGTQTRDFTYVEDTARGILAIGFNDEAIGTTINIGSGYEIAINDLARVVAEVTAQDHPEISHDTPRPGDVLRLYAETSRARSLGFDPKISLEDGLLRLKRWYCSLERAPMELLNEEVLHNWESKPRG